MSQRPAPVVLVVEDEHLIRMLAVDAFSDAGFLVVEAQNAAEALRMYAAHTDITVLFTDVNMPGAMNGIDLAESLKALAPDLHVLVTSALPILATGRSPLGPVHSQALRPPGRLRRCATAPGRLTPRAPGRQQRPWAREGRAGPGSENTRKRAEPPKRG